MEAHLDGLLRVVAVVRRLGKHAGAKVYHRAIMDYSWIEIVTAVGQSVLSKCKVLCGVGIVENAYDETALIAGVAPQDFLRREKELLVLAKQWMPRLPFRKVDLLIVDDVDCDGAIVKQPWVKELNLKR